MTVMCFLFQVLLGERAFHMTVIFCFVSRAVGGRGQST